METITFETTINAPASVVWRAITERASYEDWTGVAFPGSTFEGEWKQGQRMRFVGPDGSGTVVNVKK